MGQAPDGAGPRHPLPRRRLISALLTLAVPHWRGGDDLHRHRRRPRLPSFHPAAAGARPSPDMGRPRPARSQGIFRNRKRVLQARPRGFHNQHRHPLRGSRCRLSFFQRSAPPLPHRSSGSSAPGYKSAGLFSGPGRWVFVMSTAGVAEGAVVGSLSGSGPAVGVSTSSPDCPTAGLGDHQPRSWPRAQRQPAPVRGSITTSAASRSSTTGSHLAGGRFLQRAAQKSGSRPCVVSGIPDPRYGGDEFAVLLPLSDPPQSATHPAEDQASTSLVVKRAHAADPNTAR